MNIIDTVRKKGVFAVDYISTIDAGEKWSLSNRRVAILCSEGRIPGVKKVGNTWLIPADAEKPADARVKTGKYKRYPDMNKNKIREWGVNGKAV